MPRSSIRGERGRQQVAHGGEDGRFCAVASVSVCDRVAREKSSKRSRSITVRHARPPLRIRRPTRSTSPTRTASNAAGERGPRPNAHCAPIERRRRPTRTRRGSRLWASACSWRPAARPSISTSAGSAYAATSPTVAIPRARSFSEVAGPTPHSRSTGSGCRNASSPPCGTTSSPSGFAIPLATLARNFVRGDPDRDRQPDLVAHPAPQPLGDLGRRPASRRIPRRRGTPRRSTGPPPAASCPRTSRTPPGWPPRRRRSAGAPPPMSGHSRRARAPPIAVRTPRAFAS